MKNIFKVLKYFLFQTFLFLSFLGQMELVLILCSCLGYIILSRDHRFSFSADFFIFTALFSFYSVLFPAFSSSQFSAFNSFFLVLTLILVTHSHAHPDQPLQPRSPRLTTAATLTPINHYSHAHPDQPTQPRSPRSTTDST